MSRIQLALNVANLDESIEFYSKLFQTQPSKIREGYANFSIANPPLKLILFTGMGQPGSLNHVGVEVETTDEVAATIARVETLGIEQEIQENVSCCFAVQDKTWIKGPDNDWEFYTVLADAPTMSCASDANSSGWSDTNTTEAADSLAPATATATEIARSQCC